jgi:hypothetical protein
MYEYVAPTLGKLDDAIHEMLEDWNTLNWDTEAKVSEIVYDASGSLPVPDETQFMRHVGQNMPIVIRASARGWNCVQKWSKVYLIDKMGRRQVKVAITPDG